MLMITTWEFSPTDNIFGMFDETNYKNTTNGANLRAYLLSIGFSENDVNNANL